MKKGKIILIVVLSVFVLLASTAGAYLYNILHRTTNTSLLDNLDRVGKWKADLASVKTQLPKLHKNLFFSLTKVEFDSEMDSLLQNCPNMNDNQIKAELAKIINAVNDSHTSANISGDRIYPFSFFEFKEGIFLSNSTLEYKNLWGHKLIEINGYTTDQIKTMIDPFISHDNKAIMKSQFSSMIRSADLLKIAGITTEDEAVFTFENGSGKTGIKVKPAKQESFSKEKLLADDPGLAEKFPLPKQNMEKNYWFKYDEKDGIVYVKYNSCSNMPGYSFSAFTKDVFRTVDEKKPAALVVDLRDNGGGNSAIFSPFLGETKKHESVNQKNRLFVIVGRRTFSSAILNAMDLKNKTNAVLVGEPTGGRPNHFGEVKVLHLSNVNIDIYYSSNYFRTTNEDTDGIYPDIPVETTAASYFNGKDDCIEAIDLLIKNR